MSLVHTRLQALLCQVQGSEVKDELHSRNNILGNFHEYSKITSVTLLATASQLHNSSSLSTANTVLYNVHTSIRITNQLVYLHHSTMKKGLALKFVKLYQVSTNDGFGEMLYHHQSIKSFQLRSRCTTHSNLMVLVILQLQQLHMSCRLQPLSQSSCWGQRHHTRHNKLRELEPEL